jgi:hypothetical protein
MEAVILGGALCGLSALLVMPWLFVVRAVYVTWMGIGPMADSAESNQLEDCSSCHASGDKLEPEQVWLYFQLFRNEGDTE